MIYQKELFLRTERYQEYVKITGQVEQIVVESGIRDGLVNVVSKPPTAGITVNEGLECLESDIETFLGRLVPEDGDYSHARMLRSYGSTAGNPTGHLRALLTGNHCHFSLSGRRLIRGNAQEIYFCEFDGPAVRDILVMVQGE